MPLTHCRLVLSRYYQDFSLHIDERPRIPGAGQTTRRRLTCLTLHTGQFAKWPYGVNAQIAQFIFQFCTPDPHFLSKMDLGRFENEALVKKYLVDPVADCIGYFGDLINLNEIYLD